MQTIPLLHDAIYPTPGRCCNAVGDPDPEHVDFMGRQGP